jgi:hypothetical protein
MSERDAWIMDALHRIEQQQTTIIDVLNLLVDGLDKAQQPKPKLHPPKVMQVSGFTLARTPVEDAGWLVQKFDHHGDLIDQAFQHKTGEWRTVQMDDGALLLTGTRDAIIC